MMNKGVLYLGSALFMDKGCDSHYIYEQKLKGKQSSVYPLQVFPTKFRALDRLAML